MAEHMAILDAQGRAIGSMVVETAEQQGQVAAALKAQGLRLDEPGEPPDLERGGDLEADDCDENLPEGQVDNCAIAVCVSYSEDFCRRHGVSAPRLHQMVANRRVPGSSEARAAIVEAVEAVQGSRLGGQELDEIRAYVRYGYPDLAQRLPVVAPARAVTA